MARIKTDEMHLERYNDKCFMCFFFTRNMAKS